MFQLNFPQNKNKTHTHKKEKQLSKFAQKLKRKRKRTIMIIVMFDKALPKKTMMSEEREREREKGSEVVFAHLEAKPNSRSIIHFFGFFSLLQFI